MKLCEGGHTLLYTTVFIPIVLGGVALAFDVSGINLKSERVQSLLDTIALDAAHSLPDIEVAKNKGLSRFNEIGEPLVSSSVEIDPYRSRVTLSITIAENKFILPKLLESVGIKSLIQPQRFISEAELLPIDASIILSDGAEVRPWKDATDKTPWPESNGVGQASSALNGCIMPPMPRYSNSVSPMAWSDSKDWLTQSCFNPIFSNFKLAAMNLSGSLLSVGTNRAAVIFTPGHNGLGEIIRHAIPEQSVDKTLAGYVKVGEAPRATWFPAKDLEYELGDEACIVFSDDSTAVQGEYSLDKFTGSDSNQRRCLNPVSNSKCGEPFSIGQVDRLDLNCLEEASLAEGIYWRSAKRPANNFSGAPDIYSALALGLSEVIPITVQSKLDRAVRGQLADAPGRIIIVLTSILPEVDPTNMAIQGIIKSGTALIIGFLERPEFPSPLVDTNIQTQRVIQWQNFLHQQSGISRIKSGVYVAKSPADLNQNIVPKIISITRRVLLRK